MPHAGEWIVLSVSFCHVPRRLGVRFHVPGPFHTPSRIESMTHTCQGQKTMPHGRRMWPDTVDDDDDHGSSIERAEKQRMSGCG